MGLLSHPGNVTISLMDIRDGLNAEQQRALDVVSGPVLILAGAGSGKTKTLTHRIAHLIDEQRVWPNEILAVTFTNKAAREMRQRLWRLLEAGRQPAVNQTVSSNSLRGEAEGPAPPRDFMPWMGTFHSVCVRLLRVDGGEIGIAANFVIYDEDDRVSLIKKAMKSLSITDKQVKPKAVSSAISGAKNSLIGPEEYAETAQFPFSREVARIYAQYEVDRRAANALDFDDLLIETVRLLRDVPAVRHKWRQHFKHIVIDEYQDTNAAQYAIVKSLVGDEQNICVVGDDWQSIYSWRGADFTNILNFERDFPGTVVIKLEQNYRSTGSILEAAHQVITKNTQRTDKRLWTDGGSGQPVEVHPAYDEGEEAFGVASRIGAQVQIGARRYSDFAVLYRMNSLSYTLERALLTAHIPYQIIGGVRFYDRAEIKDIVAYLRLVYQPMDIMSFSRIVNVPKRGIGATSLEKFLAWQASTGMDLIAALVNAEQASGLTPRARQSLQRLGELLRGLQVMVEQAMAPAEIIDRLVEGIDYRDYLLDGTPQAEDREANLGSLVSDAQSFATLADFLEEVALMSSIDSAQSGDKVTLMTVHAAKGLEFPVVFMVGLEEGVFPHSRVFEAGGHELEEERRLCYVGMTRAREELHLSYATSRMQFGQRSYSMPSRFLSDMGHKLAEVPLDNTPSTASQALASDEFSDLPNYSEGERVRSAQFGAGEVSEVDGMAVTVLFDSGQQKKLNVEFARLEKIA